MKIDLTSAAIDKRMKRVAILRKLCLSLARAKKIEKEEKIGSKTRTRKYQAYLTGE